MIFKLKYYVEMEIWSAPDMKEGGFPNSRISIFLNIFFPLSTPNLC